MDIHDRLGPVARNKSVQMQHNDVVTFIDELQQMSPKHYDFINSVQFTKTCSF